jgi:dihydrofolate reductase
MPRSRRVIVYISISADGFIARKDGSFDFLDRPRPKGNYGMDEFYKSIDTILWGRKTYDLAVAFQREGKMQQPFDPKLKHYVFTRTLAKSSAPAGVEFVDQPIKKFAAGLRATKGKKIWMMGGAGVIGSFLDAGAIDEFIIHVIPKLIGEGIPLVEPAHRNIALRLLASKKFPDGVVRLHYAVRQ